MVADDDPPGDAGTLLPCAHLVWTWARPEPCTNAGPNASLHRRHRSHRVGNRRDLEVVVPVKGVANDWSEPSHWSELVVNDSVEVVGGPGDDRQASLISLERIEPTPACLVEFGDGTSAVLPLGELRRASLGDSFVQ